MGRRKIEIQPLTDDRNRTVTFVKRKAGLFKKAHELAVLCQVELAVIIVGNNNKLYEFSSVDTNELIKVYQNTPKVHESKSPANYGNYKKKKYVKTRTMIHDDEEVDHDDDIEEEDGDGDYDSDTPEPPRKRSRQATRETRRVRPPAPNHISLTNVPTFNSFRNHAIKEEDEEDVRVARRGFRPESTTRPVLRVQIPTDAKGQSADSARTVTALETTHPVGGLPSKSSQMHTSDTPESSKSDMRAAAPGSVGSNGSVSGPSLNTPKFSSFGAFRSPATAKHLPALPIPIHSKSQTSSPSSATAPQLPTGGGGPGQFFNTLPQPSPSSQFPPGSMQTPIFNQMFANDQRYRFHSSASIAGANGNNGPNGNPGGGGANNGGVQPSGEMPMSALPSRYINDIFPSPYNFYVPSDWPQSGSGMTPYHSLPQYFMNIPPNQGSSRGGGNGGLGLAGGSGGGGSGGGGAPTVGHDIGSSTNQSVPTISTTGTKTGTTTSSSAGSTSTPSQQSTNSAPSLPPPSVVQQQQVPSYQDPSSLSFMGQQYQQGKKS